MARCTKQNCSGIRVPLGRNMSTLLVLVCMCNTIQSSRFGDFYVSCLRNSQIYGDFSGKRNYITHSTIRRNGTRWSIFRKQWS